jgi:hypothetical protein
MHIIKDLGILLWFLVRMALMYGLVLGVLGLGYTLVGEADGPCVHLCDEP